MDQNEANRIFLKAFRKGPLDLFLSEIGQSGEFQVTVLHDKGTEYQMLGVSFKTVATLIRKTYQDMEANGIIAATNSSNQKTHKELLKFYNFMQDKDLPEQIPSIGEITYVINRLQRQDNVEKFIKKVSSLLNEKKSIIEYINASSKDYNGDKNKAWQVAIEQIKKSRVSYRNMYLNNEPESCQTDWILHPKGLYKK